MSTLSKILKGLKKLFSCCYKTVNIADHLTGGDDSESGSDKTHNENHNNININVPAVKVAPKKELSGKTKILVDKGDTHEKLDYNQPVNIHIAGSVHMAPNADFVIHADRHNRASGDYNSYDISDSSSEDSPLLIDTEKMIMILKSNHKRKLVLDYDDIKASPTLTDSFERIVMHKSKTIHPKVTSAVEIVPKHDEDETSKTLSMMHSDLDETQSDVDTVGNEAFDIDKPLHHTV